jgi:hypothetical protein
MRDYWWCLTNEKGVHMLWKFFLRHAHALVLPEVLDPGANNEGLVPPRLAWTRNTRSSKRFSLSPAK